ncbi:MAG: hypothetical protein IPM66_03135 [Acidobacteriota bacterium]|nr:MAG: hypothetical protein IPM66_03135 [Acidobacteriota bacterium]
MDKIQPCIFTICSNNYLAQAFVLGKSLHRANSEMHLLIVLTDKRLDYIDYEQYEFIKVIEIEEIYGDPRQLCRKYNIVEFNTALKPYICQYLLFDNEIVMYFDPDICIYSKLTPIIEALDFAQIALTPHIITPIKDDGKLPNENQFLKFGLYNLGFIALRKGTESLKMLDWWSDHTQSKCFIDTQKGQYTDQLPVNFAPLFFNDVTILTDLGMNMAPWNLHERHLEIDDCTKEYIVNSTYKLLFYHFSNFTPGNPVMVCKNDWYNRYSIEIRPDLKKLYSEYSDALIDNDYEKYNRILCYYYPDVRKKNYLRRMMVRSLERALIALKNNS